MALDNIPTLGPGGFNGNLDKVLVYKNGGSEVACSLLTLTNSALNIAGVYLDPMNQRVGINNPNPVTALDVIGAGRFYQAFAIGVPSLFAYNGRAEADSTLRLDNPGGGKLYFGGFGLLNETNAAFGQLSAPSARVHIKGSGSTSATTSLLVQNSSGTAALQVADNGNTSLGSPNFNDRLEVYGNILVRANDRIRLAGTSDGNTALYATSGATAQINVKNGSGSTFDVTFGSIVSNTRMLRINSYDSTTPSVVVGNNATSVASAVLVAESTTQGFLPPRMTSAQKNLIASPAAGLMVYDTDLNRPCFYSGSAWVTL